MTARRQFITVALSGALAVAVLAPFAPAASAAPAAPFSTSHVADRAASTSADRVAVRSASAGTPIVVDQIGDDPLAGWAKTALMSFGSEAFDAQRDALATAIAQRLWIDPTQLQQAWRETTPQHQVALLAAMTQLGVPYRRMRSNPGQGFDCSGLTTFAWGLAGKTLPRSSGSQIRAAAKVSADDAKAGDLVWYPGHVMMSLGIPGAIIHSPYTGRDVEVDWVVSRRANRVKYGDPAA
jgi:cell wall-associated NlpC family hydrolase